MSADSLKDKAVSGAIWRTIELFCNQAIAFVIGIILARLLSPEDYGAIGMLTIFFSVAGCFRDCGFGTALVQNKDRTEEDYSTAFIFNVCTSILVFILLFIGAPFIADFYNMPILTDITRVSALSLVISGFTGIQYAKLNIELNFKFRSQLSVLATILTGITGITLAFMGFGVWALVLQGLVSGIITGIVLWICSGWKPKLVFSKKSFKHLWKFGSNILGSGLINTIYNNLYTLVIGKCYNPASVGMYNRANGYASLPTSVIMDMALGINFPILAKLQNDRERLLGAYEKLLKVPFYVLYPVLIGLIVLADPTIQVMIGDKWLPCVPYLQILCVGYMFFPLNGLNVNLLMVKGRPDLVLKLDFIKKPVGILLLVAAIPFGIIWMMVGKAAYSVIVYSMNCYYTNKILDYGFIKQVKVLIPIILNSLFMGVIVFIVTYFLHANILKLVIGIPLGLLVYATVGYFRRDEALFEIINIVKSKLKNE